MCAGATGGLLPTPSEARDCCLRGKEGGSIGGGKMEMQPTREHWPLCHLTFRLLSTFTTTSVQTPCQTHNLFFLGFPFTPVSVQRWERKTGKTHITLESFFEPSITRTWISPASGRFEKRRQVQHGAANNWDVSGLPVRWPHSTSNASVFAGQLISWRSDRRCFNGGGKGTTFQWVDPRLTPLSC